MMQALGPVSTVALGASTAWLVFCCCWHSLNLVHATLWAKALVPAAWPLRAVDKTFVRVENVEGIDYL